MMNLSKKDGVLRASKQGLYDQHIKEQKMLHKGETVEMFRDGNWKPAIAVEKLNEPRSYNVKTENRSTYRRNWKHF